MYTIVPFRRAMNTAFVPLFNDHFMREFFDMDGAPEMRVDVREKDGAYLLEADLPGVKKEDIHIDIDGDYLSITAQRNSEKSEKDKEGNYIRCERSYGSFSRSFDISGVKAENITAAYDNGVLTLTMPKREATVPTSRRLEIQ